MNISIGDLVYHKLTWRIGRVIDKIGKSFLIDFGDEQHLISCNLEKL